MAENQKNATFWG